MIALLRKARRRSVSELLLLISAVAIRAALVVLLRVVRFGALRRIGTMLARARPRRAAADAAAAFERRVAWAVATAGALLPATHTCLADALTAYWLLEAGGCRSTIRFGVATTPPPPQALRAHAWVEASSGIVVGAVDHASFATLD